MNETTRVLVVDDDDIVRRTLALALDETGWEICAVDSAEAAMARLGERWHALVVDKNLPGMSGVELVRLARERDESLAVFMVTGYGSTDTALEMLHLRVDGYLEKPFDDILSVVRRVHEAVARRRGDCPRRELSGAIDHFKRASAHLLTRAPVAAGDGALRVLVATPSPSDAAWITARLVAAGDRVEQATTDEQALARLQRAGAQAVFLDLALAPRDPVNWLAAVVQSTPSVATVVISSRPPPSVVARFIELDVRAVLEKPLTNDQYDRRVAPLMEGLRRVRGKRSAG